MFAALARLVLDFSELVSQQKPICAQYPQRTCSLRKPQRGFGVCVGLHPRSVEQRSSQNPDVSGTTTKSNRITDELGWYDQRVTLLLPETDRDGAIPCGELGANDSARRGAECRYRYLPLSVDDQWARGSRWLESETSSLNRTDPISRRFAHLNLKDRRLFPNTTRRAPRPKRWWPTSGVNNIERRVRSRRMPSQSSGHHRQSRCSSDSPVETRH